MVLDAQSSKNISFIGGYYGGPSYAITTLDSLVIIGSGATIDFTILNNSTLLFKSNFTIRTIVRNLKIFEKHLYVAADDGLYIIDITDINFPKLKSYFPTGSKCTSVDLQSDRIFLAESLTGMHIIDSSELEHLTLVTTFKPDSLRNLSKVCVKDSLAYLCDSKGSLSIVNVRQTSNPYVQSVQNFSYRYHPTSIAIKGNYVFVGTEERNNIITSGKLFVVNVSEPSTPKIEKSFGIPGDMYSAATDILIQDSLLFMSYRNDVIQGVEIYNISTLPTPKLVNSISYGPNNTIITATNYSISLTNGLLFVSEATNGVTAHNVADLSKVNKVISYQTNARINELISKGNVLYAACGESGFKLFDYSSLPVIKNISKPLNRIHYGSVNSVSVQDSLAFLACRVGGAGIQVYSLKDKNTHSEIGSNYEGEGNKIIVKGNYAYLASRFHGLYVFDISLPMNPKKIFNSEFDISGNDLFIYDSFCYLATSNNGIIEYDISKNEAVKEVRRIKVDGNALNTIVKDNILLVAVGSKEIQITSLSNVEQSIIFNENFTNVRRIAVDKNYLFVVDDNRGLLVYDIKDIFHPMEVAFHKLSMVAMNILIVNDLIFLSQGDGGFSVYKNLISSNIEERKNIPYEYSLSQNYPNPFNPETTIEYTIPVETRHSATGGSSLQHVTLKVYDVLGKEVATLVDEYKQPGNYKVTFNAGHAKRSRSIPSSVYFYQLTAGSCVQTKKLLLLK